MTPSLYKVVLRHHWAKLILNLLRDSLIDSIISCDTWAGGKNFSNLQISAVKANSHQFF